MRTYYPDDEYAIEGRKLLLIDFLGTIYSYKTGLREYTSEFFKDWTDSGGRIYVHSDFLPENLFPELMTKFGLVNYVDKYFGNKNLVSVGNKNLTIKDFGKMVSIADVAREETLIISDEDELAAMAADVDLFKVPRYCEGGEHFSFLKLRQQINKLEYV